MRLREEALLIVTAFDMKRIVRAGMKELLRDYLDPISVVSVRQQKGGKYFEITFSQPSPPKPLPAKIPPYKTPDA